MNYELTTDTFGNGLRVAVAPSEGNVAYIGLLVNAGSREDPAELDGMAHFVEHTLFKGTRNRRSWQISNRMESVGGELNAYTTKEEIMLYTNAPAGYEDRAIELLADLARDASFPEADIDRERGVIFEEIHSYADTPSSAVFDEFDELFFKGSPLAHNILGYTPSVERISGHDARGFLERYFAPENMVVYCMAPGDPQKHLARIEKYFGSLSRPRPTITRVPPQAAAAFDETRNLDNHQANALLGTRIPGYGNDLRYALYLFSNILGGPAMNSILNRELRDRRGLVYTAECSMALYSDVGNWQVYFGCEPRAVEKCTAIVKREIERLAASPLSDKTFRQARRQLCGQLLVSGDNLENRAMAMAKGILRHGEIHDTRHTADRIMQLTAEDVRRAAETVATGPLSRLVLV